ncbi:MAG: lytic transglycosylase domain-containing protein, partial [Bacteroidota bacterium]|nr:lytic transglycosylase domain-containing protein [Bacteroidota bacterium]MDX5429847.1 lytic transglycosylase domain-containing protein [Bacteroidota bacterium]MDX5468626.1 lytic transglycosylase domain-containing protein [Bacteroidota bacterium]
MKKTILYMLLGTSIWAQAQTVTTERQKSAEPILATLDSLTQALHNHGFLKNAEFIQADQLDFNSGDLPNYPGTLIQSRMNSLGSEIALEYNSYVKGFLDLYGVRKRDLTAKMLGLSDYYFPIYEEILDRNNLPLELKYLSVVESALNPKATSWAGASGPWQFIYSTGVRYGLTINSYVDERRDIYKSTQAACDYFKDSYALYGDWLLVIASYNCGPGNVNKAIRRAGGSKNFWEIQKFLP